MNEIDLLKRVRDDVPSPDPLVLARARQRLLTRAPVRRRRLATRPRLVVTGALAVTLAAGFLVNDVVTHNGGTAPGAVADAGTFLATAAELTSADPDAPIPPGQYRQVTQRSRNRWNFGPGNRFQGTSLNVSDWWIPADHQQLYTLISMNGTKKQFSSEAAKKYWLETANNGGKPQIHKSANVCGVASNGAAVFFRVKEARKDCIGSMSDPTTDFLAQLPRDPDALLAALRTDPLAPVKGSVPDSTTPRADSMAFRRVTTILASGIAPADLRAALYQAAGKIPGIQLQADAVNLAGRTGRAISLVLEFGIRTELIIEPRTGQFLGLREVATRTAPPYVPRAPQRNDVLRWTSVTTRITPTRPAVR